MTPEAIARLRRASRRSQREPRALAARFYQELFTAAPSLRPLFPADLTSLQGHFEAALALVFATSKRCGRCRSRCAISARSTCTGARSPRTTCRPRGADSRHPRLSAAGATTLEADWRRAITAIAVPMLQGAAVHTAMVAERLSEE